jgi:hypothetical protein
LGERRHATTAWLRRICSVHEEARVALAPMFAAHDLPDATLNRAEVILEELIANVIRHGFPRAPTSRSGLPAASETVRSRTTGRPSIRCSRRSRRVGRVRAGEPLTVQLQIR